MRKFKTIGILSFCIIYLLVSCLFSSSFAALYTANENVTPGKYYIKNKSSGFYMGSLDFYSVIHTSFNPETDMQKWELEYIYDGYYRIKNVYSGYYLTASDPDSPGDLVTEQFLFSSDEAQIWKLNELDVNEDYYWEYKMDTTVR